MYINLARAGNLKLTYIFIYWPYVQSYDFDDMFGHMINVDITQARYMYFAQPFGLFDLDSS